MSINHPCLWAYTARSKGNWLTRGHKEENVQKLRVKFKNVPTDASLVCSSTRPGLNREETLSAQDIVLTRNSLEVNLRQRHTGGLTDKVYVKKYKGF